MIVAGAILIILSWAISQVFPGAAPPAPGLEHVAWVIGWVFVVIGFILWLLGSVFHRPVGGRQFWW